MILWCLLSLLLSIRATSCTESDESTTTEENVYVLTDSNFRSFLNENRNVLVEFYAPWCGHCKKLAPHYSQAAETLKTSQSKALLAKVDATKESEVAKITEIQGYPTLKLFLNGLDGDIVDYDGGRTAEEIVAWMNEKTDPNYKPPPSSVLTLTTSNFTEVVSNADLILVEFYAPWCGHCKRLAPEYEKAAQKLSQIDKPIPLAKVDATVEKELKDQHHVTGFPTLKIFRKGRSFDYKGPRDKDGIADYMQIQAKDALVEIESLKEAEKVLPKNDISIIGFFDKTRDNDGFFEMFKEACEEIRDDFTNLFFTYDNELKGRHKAKTNSVAIVYPEIFWSKYEPRVAFFDKADASRQEIVKFIKEKCTPLVGHRTRANQEVKYAKRPLVVAYYTVDFSYLHRDETEHWRRKILDVAKDFSADYTFAVSDEEEYTDELNEIGLSDSGLEVNVIVFGQNKRRYKMDPDVYDEFAVASFGKFMKRLSEGGVKPFVKSQPVPKESKAAVKTLVGSNVESVAMDETKDVLLELYAPWCGHCKALEPIYEELAEKLKKDQNLIIAKMDATANDVPDPFAVDGFPSIYFAAKGRKKEPMKYEGGRTVDEMLAFLKQNSVASFQRKTEL